MAKLNENTVIKRPARPKVMSKSFAIKGRIPPIINSTNPTIKVMVVKIYTLLSIKFLPKKQGHPQWEAPLSSRSFAL